MKSLPLALLLLSSPGSLLSTQALSLQTTYPVGSGIIPDGDLNGRAEMQTITGIDGTITRVAVRVSLQGTGPDGGWNGDIYASLQHESGFAVLINRPGRRIGSEFGSAGDGFDIVLEDLAPQGDIHASLPGNNVLTGNWAPDGRNLSPTASLGDFSNATRSALLSSFVGLPVSGDWTLLVLDASSGGQMELREWGLSIDYLAQSTQGSVPDASGSLPLLGLGILALLTFPRPGKA